MNATDFSSSELEYITSIVFGLETDPEQCKVGFIFGTTHPEATKAAITAFHAGFYKHLIVTGGYKPTRREHSSWTHGLSTESEATVPELVRLGIRHTARSDFFREPIDQLV